VTLFTHTLPELEEEAVSLGLPVVAGEVVAVEAVDDRVTGLRLADGSVHAVETVAVGPRARLRAPYLTGLGLAVEQHPSGMGEYVPVDAVGRTAVTGVWAAGNLTDPSAQVGMAAAQAAIAAAGMVGEFAFER
jgi:thioredoxin reductase